MIKYRTRKKQIKTEHNRLAEETIINFRNKKNPNFF